MDYQEEMSLNEKLTEISNGIRTLQDLFSRRLMEDKQKKQLIQALIDEAEFTSLKPILYEIILLLDRLSQANDDYSISIREELFNIFHHRGLDYIVESQTFDPEQMKAVRIVESPNVNELSVSKTIRKGYQFCGIVIRPAEVIVERPIRKETEKGEDEES